VDRDDYQRVVRPLDDETRDNPQKLRLLLELAPDLRAITPGAMLEEFKTPFPRLGRMERCALVTDSEPLRGMAERGARLLPLPLRTYPVEQRDAAVDWLSRPAEQRGLSQRYREDLHVLVIRPHGKLHVDDFEALALTVDTLLAQSTRPLGLVIHVDALTPEWNDPGSFLRHMQFVRGHHKRIARVALVSKGVAIASLAAKVLQRFVAPQVMAFPEEALQSATTWAAGAPSDRPGNGAGHPDPVTEAGMESFPASDPPAHSPGGG
jgi:hypothetical protein